MQALYVLCVQRWDHLTKLLVMKPVNRLIHHNSETICILALCARTQIISSLYWIRQLTMYRLVNAFSATSRIVNETSSLANEFLSLFDECRNKLTNLFSAQACTRRCGCISGMPWKLYERYELLWIPCLILESPTAISSTTHHNPNCQQVYQLHGHHSSGSCAG